MAYPMDLVLVMELDMNIKCIKYVIILNMTDWNIPEDGNGYVIGIGHGSGYGYGMGNGWGE
jgi:hypothetical protein